MRALKIIGITLLVVLVILIIVAYLLPSNIKVERSLFIKADASAVFDQVNSLKNWEQWSPWHHLDSNMKLTYSGPASGTNAVYEWQSDHPSVGNGRLSILSSHPNDSILVEMDFGKRGKSKAGFYLSKLDSGVTLSWVLYANMGKNPVSRYIGLFLEKMIGPDFEKGLKNIQQISESFPRYSVTKISHPATEYVYIRDTCTMEDISDKMQQYFGEIMTYVQANRLKMNGYPFTLYHSWENGVYDMEVAIPVENAKADTRIHAGKILPCTVATVDFYGPYEKIEAAYNSITAWMKSNNIKATGNPWESYITNPTAENDTSKWLTKIYWPIE